MRGRVVLFELGSKEGDGFSDGFADIYSAGSSWGCGSEAAKTPDEVIDSRNLSNDDFGEVLSKLFVIVPLGKEFRECPYRDEGVLDLMSHA